MLKYIGNNTAINLITHRSVFYCASACFSNAERNIVLPFFCLSVRPSVLCPWRYGIVSKTYAHIVIPIGPPDTGIILGFSAQPQ